MAKRRPRPSALRHRYAERGLTWNSEAARLLHIDRTLIEERIRSGDVKREHIELPDGQRFNGIPLAEIDRLHAAMWPNCDRDGCAYREVAG